MSDTDTAVEVATLMDSESIPIFTPNDAEMNAPSASRVTIPDESMDNETENKPGKSRRRRDRRRKRANWEPIEFESL